MAQFKRKVEFNASIICLEKMYSTSKRYSKYDKVLILLICPERLRTRFFYSSDEADETPEEFTRKWVNFFDSAPDLFEVQRGLNITFGGDIVPTGPIVAAALRAARRYDDFPTTVRVFAGLRGKLPKKTQYEAYLKALSDEMNEIGAATPEELNQ